MKKLLVVLAICSFAACNSASSSESKTDSAAKSGTESVNATADSSKAVIDSTASAAKDSMKAKVDSTKK
jgi:hypothetical protein